MSKCIVYVKIYDTEWTNEINSFVTTLEVDKQIIESLYTTGIWLNECDEYTNDPEEYRYWVPPSCILGVERLVD